MDKLRAIIIDDEESARDVLENLLSRFCPEVEVLAKFGGLPESVSAVETLKPDLLFLDIRMPNYAGFEVVSFFPDPFFEIIFVTAYDEYAVRAFEIAAVDYLLKPVDIHRLKAAVKRAAVQQNAKKQIEQLEVLSSALGGSPLSKIMVVDKGNQHVVELSSIIAIEAMESYCILHTTERKFTVSKNLKHFENLLDSLPFFFRVHKSWMINKNFLESYSRADLQVRLKYGVTAKLSKYKKAEFEAFVVK